MSVVLGTTKKGAGSISLCGGEGQTVSMGEMQISRNKTKLGGVGAGDQRSRRHDLVIRHRSRGKDEKRKRN